MNKILFILIFTLTFIFSSVESQAKHLYKEAVYQNYWCSQHNGIAEYKLADKSRVDCLLPDMAVEVDFARKRDECLGQALRYSAYTKKKPACLLIVENEKDYKYVRQLRYTISKKALDVSVFIIKPSTLIKAGIFSENIQ